MLHNVMIIIISARASLFKVIEAIFSRVAAKSLYISRAVRNFYQIEFETKLIFAQPAGNQIYIVTFMCLTVDTSFIFTKKNQMLQNGFFISVMLRWYSGIKNHEIWTFKVNFLCQKMSESFYFFFH